MSDISYYKLAIWRALCERDRQETEEKRKQDNTPAPPPHCLQRKIDAYAAMDEMGESASRVVARFKEQA